MVNDSAKGPSGQTTSNPGHDEDPASLSFGHPRNRVCAIELKIIGLSTGNDWVNNNDAKTAECLQKDLQYCPTPLWPLHSFDNQRAYFDVNKSRGCLTWDEYYTHDSRHWPATANTDRCQVMKSIPRMQTNWIGCFLPMYHQCFCW